ncbi:uncharacterized protein LOC141899056 [Tubulanus polymorphus]|uniref:uncharacterized protein LOC141899056 n=1 Tax=Tubulanus polymorphus TaxID=672921 RepID=UPI003DA468B8
MDDSRALKRAKVLNAYHSRQFEIESKSLTHQLFLRIREVKSGIRCVNRDLARFQQHSNYSIPCIDHTATKNGRAERRKWREAPQVADEPAVIIELEQRPPSTIQTTVNQWNTSSVQLYDRYNSKRHNPQRTAAAKTEQSQIATIKWSFIFVGFSVAIFAIATCQYLRKRTQSPKAKRKARLLKIQKKRAKEEHRIENVNASPIPVEVFAEVLKKRKAHNDLSIEFKRLQKYQAFSSCSVAEKPGNELKNSATAPIPFDHSRVVLDVLPGQVDSDYINASWVHGYRKPRSYIAAQGPNRYSVNDFWRMIWQYDCHCIVMATNLFEHARQQCEKYWHNTHAFYDGIDVWLDETEETADFTIRTFRITKTGCDEVRIVKQFQFGNWSDHDCPQIPAVLEYRRQIKVYMIGKPGPLLVHCSAGAGRTGTFITIDAMLDQGACEKQIAIYNFIAAMRRNRPSMVRDLAQYQFIYEAVNIHLKCQVTAIPSSALNQVVQRLSFKEPKSRMTGFEREFKTLQSVVPKLTAGECAGGHRAENRWKSRDVMLQPPERSRPYLMTHDSCDSADFINAVYVDGYYNLNSYIVTQWPQRNTINDIWRLAYDYHTYSIVLLNELPGSRAFPQFWPEKMSEAKIYGPIVVEMIEDMIHPNVRIRRFKIRKRLASLHDFGNQEKPKIIQMFQLTCWPNRHKIPSSSAALLELMMTVENWQHETNPNSPICVMSKNGVSRCGIYCALNIAFDKMRAEGEVDIFKAVRTVKSNRYHLVENLVEYIYCYTFMVVLLEILKFGQYHLGTPVNNDTPKPVDPDRVTEPEPCRRFSEHFMRRTSGAVKIEVTNPDGDPDDWLDVEDDTGNKELPPDGISDINSETSGSKIVQGILNASRGYLNPTFSTDSVGYSNLGYRFSICSERETPRSRSASLTIEAHTPGMCSKFHHSLCSGQFKEDSQESKQLGVYSVAYSANNVPQVIIQGAPPSPIIEVPTDHLNLDSVSMNTSVSIHDFGPEHFHCEAEIHKPPVQSDFRADMIDYKQEVSVNDIGFFSYSEHQLDRRPSTKSGRSILRGCSNAYLFDHYGDTPNLPSLQILAGKSYVVRSPSNPQITQDDNFHSEDIHSDQLLQTKGWTSCPHVNSTDNPDIINNCVVNNDKQQPVNAEKRKTDKVSSGICSDPISEVPEMETHGENACMALVLATDTEKNLPSESKSDVCDNILSKCQESVKRPTLQQRRKSSLLRQEAIDIPPSPELEPHHNFLPASTGKDLQQKGNSVTTSQRSALPSLSSRLRNIPKLSFRDNSVETAASSSSCTDDVHQCDLHGDIDLTLQPDLSQVSKLFNVDIGAESANAAYATPLGSNVHLDELALYGLKTPDIERDDSSGTEYYSFEIDPSCVNDPSSYV